MANIESFVSWMSTFAVYLSVPALVVLVRARPDWHFKVFTAVARHGRKYFSVTGGVGLVSGAVWGYANPSFQPVLWNVSMWVYTVVGIMFLVPFFLGIYKQGNAALTWRGPKEAGMHVSVRRMTPREARSFIQTAMGLWLRIRAVGFSRIRLLSPLLGDAERCRQVAEMMAKVSREEGVPCRVEYLEPDSWNWLLSLIYYLKHDRKTKVATKLAMPWYRRMFRVEVGGFRLIALDD